MPLIVLVRHGQASFGTADYDELSELGRRQAELVGAELARRGLRDPELVTGRLRRQRDTARLLMPAAGIARAPTVDGRWDEYDHLDLVHRYLDPARVEHGISDSRAFQALLDEALTAWSADPADDGWARFAGGAAAALRELADRLPAGRDAVVVTSGGVIAALAAGLLQAPTATAIALNRVVVNAAITTVVIGRAGVNLMSFNDHAHFAGPGRALLTHR